jgi:hypothetical protein
LLNPITPQTKILLYTIVKKILTVFWLIPNE